MSHRAIQVMDNDEYERWRAFITWRQIQRDHARDVAEMRARR